MNTNLYYRIIKHHYGTKCAKRSKASYMQHIDEGLQILKALDAKSATAEAFCIHPIMQVPSSLSKVDVMGWNPRVVLFAMEYRNKANYFSTHMGSKPPKLILPEVTQMLVADKIQNYKEFIAHRDEYEDDNKLNAYFIAWLRHLGCDKYIYKLLTKVPFDEIVKEISEDEELKFISTV